MTKEETASPTVATENVFVAATFAAHEEGDVATVNLPDAFLHTDVDPNDDTICMTQHGKLAELMVKVNPMSYRKYVIHNDKGHMVLYVAL